MFSKKSQETVKLIIEDVEIEGTLRQVFKLAQKWNKVGQGLRNYANFEKNQQVQQEESNYYAQQKEAAMKAQMLEMQKQIEQQNNILLRAQKSPSQKPKPSQKPAYREEVPDELPPLNLGRNRTIVRL